MNIFFNKDVVWKNAEDQILKAAVMKYGTNNWARIATLLSNKSVRHCKERWFEYLLPQLTKTDWTQEEERKLIYYYKIFGTQWKTISVQLNRTVNDCIDRYQMLVNTKEDYKKLTELNEIINPHIVDAKPDEEDMNNNYAESLAEVRARLANTKGKKLRRKLREESFNEKKHKLRKLKEEALGMPYGILTKKISKQDSHLVQNMQTIKKSSVQLYNNSNELEIHKELENEILAKKNKINAKIQKKIDKATTNNQEYTAANFEEEHIAKGLDRDAIALRLNVYYDEDDIDELDDSTHKIINKKNINTVLDQLSAFWNIDNTKNDEKIEDEFSNLSSSYSFKNRIDNRTDTNLNNLMVKAPSNNNVSPITAEQFLFTRSENIDMDYANNFNDAYMTINNSKLIENASNNTELPSRYQYIFKHFVLTPLIDFDIETGANFLKYNEPIIEHKDIYCQHAYDIINDEIFITYKNDTQLLPKTELYAILHECMFNSKPIPQKLIDKIITHYSKLYKLSNNYMEAAKKCIDTALLNQKVQKNVSPHWSVNLFENELDHNKIEKYIYLAFTTKKYIKLCNDIDYKSLEELNNEIDMRIDYLKLLIADKNNKFNELKNIYSNKLVKFENNIVNNNHIQKIVDK